MVLDVLIPSLRVGSKINLVGVLEALASDQDNRRVAVLEAGQKGGGAAMIGHLGEGLGGRQANIDVLVLRHQPRQ